MRVKTMGAVTAAVLMLPVCVLAQGTAPGGTTDLELKAKQKKTVVTPKADPGAAAKDAETARKKVEGTRRIDDAAKAARPSRPDLDPAVTGGVQAKSIQRELKK
jgi:hypothetical protein